MMPKTILATAILLMATTAVDAAPITYNFAATINQVGINSATRVTVGEQIPISITVDSAFPGGPVYNYNISTPTNLITAANFNTISEDGLFQTITIVPGASIDFRTGSPQTDGGFDLMLTGAQNGALATGALPASLSAASFTGGTFSVTEVISPLIQGYSGTINGLAVTVPEPASWLLLGVGLLGLLAVRRAEHP